MTFVFDLDDTVCETNSFSKDYIQNFFIENGWPFKQVEVSTRFAEKKFDWDEKTALQWYKVHGDDMMYLFPCKKGSVELINSLYDDGHRIVFATARAEDWHTNPVALTKLWLSKNKIKYSKLYTGRIDKEQICEDEKADFFLDDDLKITAKVAEHFKDKNLKCHACLMKSEYNESLQEGEGVIRVNDFSHFAELIQSYGVEVKTSNIEV